jgi:antitoxin (DNA-binding transcriptional repressor) of toxin-antitoxin stability system
MQKVITTTYFRAHLAEVIQEVAAGTEVILAFGKGKKAQKVALSPLIPKTQTKPGLQSLLESDFYKNFKPSKEISEYKNFKDYYKKNYHPEGI